MAPSLPVHWRDLGTSRWQLAIAGYTNFPRVRKRLRCPLASLCVHVLHCSNSKNRAAESRYEQPRATRPSNVASAKRGGPQPNIVSGRDAATSSRLAPPFPHGASTERPQWPNQAAPSPPTSKIRDVDLPFPRDDSTTHYWITSSAVANSVSGMVRPSALAVLRLMANTNLVSSWIGRSPGFSPLRMRST
jgi:hypothetical protein